MSVQDIIDYHSMRAKRELDLGFTADGTAAARSHLQLASLHMQRLRELSSEPRSREPMLRM